MPPETVTAATVFGFSMVLSCRDESRFLTEGYISTEASETLIVLKAAEYADCFFDIGANLGYFSLLFATASQRTSTCYAFEPAADVYHRMVAAIEENRLSNYIHPQRCAVGSAYARRKIIINRQGSGGGSLCPDFIEEHQRSGFTEDVDVVSLHGFMEHHRLSPQYGMVKIDVEGFEKEVLTGGAQYFDSAKPPVVLIETFKHLPRRRNDSHVLSMLVRWGYEVFGIRPFQTHQPILYPAFRLGCLRRSKNGNYVAFHQRHRDLQQWCEQPESDDFLISRHRRNRIAEFQRKSIESAIDYVEVLKNQLIRQNRGDLLKAAPRWEDVEGHAS
jgi:FkbM family methyltransferase